MRLCSAEIARRLLGRAATAGKSLRLTGGLLFLLFALTVHAEPAWAQRSSDNALASAEDAFGTTVGNETIGLYTSRDVRGFDPTQAGNVRLEGLYFDRQLPPPSEVLVGRLVSGSSVRVGLSAQSYPFPAPTGIADVHLRIPGDKQVVSLVTGYGPYTKYFGELDSQIPLIAGKLGIGLGAGGGHDAAGHGGKSTFYAGAVIVRWRPSESVEIIPFWSEKFTDHLHARPSIYTAGSFIPPRIRRHTRYVQDWAVNDLDESNYGIIARATLWDDWTVRAGVFRSLVERARGANNLFQNTQPDGTADHVVSLFPSQQYGSVSGEVRVSRTLTTGKFRHRVHFAGRGRDVRRRIAGLTSVSLGKQVIGVPQVPIPQPTVTFGEQVRDHIRQQTGGIAYEGLWLGVGELSVGVQKTGYRRTLRHPGRPDDLTRDSPWLYNATLALYATEKLAVFGSYTRGMEESGDAPNYASNRGEGLPASRTSQVDAGLRYHFTPRISAVSTVFEVKKPYFNLNTANLFTRVGKVRHRGVEVSFSGKPIDGLTIVAGTVFLQARIAGEAVDQGRVGRVPIPRIPRTSRLNVEYGPAAWSGLSVDTQLEDYSSRVASIDNLARIPARTTLSVGGRYRFKVGETRALIRVQVQNITNTWGWDINNMQLAFEAIDSRRVSASLTFDF